MPCNARFPRQFCPSTKVGYSSKTSNDDFNFVAVPFGVIGFNTCDINQIVIDDGGAGSIGWGGESFCLWSGLPDLVPGSEFVLCDASYHPSGAATAPYWGDSSGNPATYSIPVGQGFVIDCTGGLTVTIKPPYDLSK